MRVARIAWTMTTVLLVATLASCGKQEQAKVEKGRCGGEEGRCRRRQSVRSCCKGGGGARDRYRFVYLRLPVGDDGAHTAGVDQRREAGRRRGPHGPVREASAVSGGRQSCSDGAERGHAVHDRVARRFQG